MNSLTLDAAQYAARLIADQHCSWSLARSKTAERFGRGIPMPDSAAIESAVREHLSIFDPAAPKRLSAFRAEALAVMHELENAGIRTWLTGAVLNGAATEESDIRLLAFSDNPKEIEMALFETVPEWEPVDSILPASFHPLETLGWLRPLRPGSVLSRLLPFASAVGVSLDVLPEKDQPLNPLKRAPDKYQTKTEASGRAGIEALEALMRETAYR